MSSMPARRTSSCVFPIWEPLCVCVRGGPLLLLLLLRRRDKLWHACE